MLRGKNQKSRAKWCVCPPQAAIFRWARKSYLAASAHLIWQLLSLHHSEDIRGLEGGKAGFFDFSDITAEKYHFKEFEGR